MLQVGTDFRLYGHDGERVYLRGAHLFAPCFGLFADGYRTDWGSRYTLYPDTPPAHCPPIGKYPDAGLTALGHMYVDDATARNKIVDLKKYGFNTLRFFVDQGFPNTYAFTDAETGVSFPPEPEIVDKILAWTREMGMYVIITNAHSSPPDASAADFWGWMGDRYKDADNLILDLQNEPGSSGGYVFNDSANPTTHVPYNTVMTDVAHWAARMGPCLTAIRDAGFVGPVAVSPYSNLWSIETIADSLDYSGNPFLDDPNLIISIHIYYYHGNTATAFSADLPNLTQVVTNYAKYHCVICSEMGFTNDFDFIDPTAATAWNKQAVGWLMKEHINGVVFFCDQPIDPNCGEFTGVISGGNLTVTGLNTNGKILLGGKITAASGGVTNDTVVISQTSGTTSSNGVYVVSPSQTVSSRDMIAHQPPNLNNIWDSGGNLTPWGQIATQFNTFADASLVEFDPIVTSTGA